MLRSFEASDRLNSIKRSTSSKMRCDVSRNRACTSTCRINEPRSREETRATGVAISGLPVIPNVPTFLPPTSIATLQPVLIQATIGMAGAILAESTLSFLGLGVVAPTPSWGAMLNDARNHLFDAPHLVVFPALGIMAAVLAFNLLGDALRDWLDPRTRVFLTTMDLSR